MSCCEHKPASAGEKSKQWDALKQRGEKEEGQSKHQSWQKYGKYRITD